MKKFLMIVLSVCIFTGIGYSAFAITTTVYTPTPKDIGDLEHGRYYAWMFNIPVLAPGNSFIEGVLKIEQIWDWTKESNDILQIHLLDEKKSGGTRIGLNPTSSVWRWNDSVYGPSDAWAGNPLIGTWTDPYGGTSAHAVTLTYTFSTLNLLETFNQYAADGKFGIGFDPDCHYYNNKITFTTTTAAPEPASLVLLGGGLLALAARRKKTLTNSKKQ